MRAFCVAAIVGNPSYARAEPEASEAPEASGRKCHDMPQKQVIHRNRIKYLSIYIYMNSNLIKIALYKSARICTKIAMSAQTLPAPSLSFTKLF